MLLNETLVNDATRGRVYKTTALILNEKALGDPLVHHYDRDFGFLGHLGTPKKGESGEVPRPPEVENFSVFLCLALSVDLLCLSLCLERGASRLGSLSLAPSIYACG